MAKKLGVTRHNQRYVFENQIVNHLNNILPSELTNTQIFNKLWHSSHMFRHYHVILVELVVCTLPSYVIMSNGAAGNKI